MSDTDPRQELAQAFDRDLDPLAEFEATFRDTKIDPFEVFEKEVLANRELSDAAFGEYRRTFRHFREFMDSQDRHPVCPNETHIKGFISYLKDERGNAPGTIKNRLMYLNAVYQYWQEDAAFPHSQDYNPVELAKKAVELNDDGPKEPPRVTVAELSEKLKTITHIRDRAIVLLQLKLGLRATEVCNIKLSEIHLANSTVRDNYDEIGSVKALSGRENAIVIPHEREGNKSRRPRMLPLDDELRQALLRYLLVRRDNGEPWLFLSKTQHGQLRKKSINRIWKQTFHPEYAETDEHRAVTSHFGRHRFTTYWRVERGLNRELLKYMRGDTPGTETLEGRGAIDEYIHTYYEDIEPIYRDQIFKFWI